MKNRDKIIYLSQYVKISDEIKLINASYNHYRDQLYKTPTANISDLPNSSNNPDKIGLMVANLEQLRNKLADRVLELQMIRENIENKIWSLSDPTQRMLMSLRYLDGKKWEEICVKLSYSWMHTHRIHSKALQAVVI